jgi:hypothetical protein
MAEKVHPEPNNQQMVRVKLSTAWASVMFMYAYSDLLGLYDQKLLESILAGQMPMFGPITPELRLGIAVMMSVPSLMVFISVVARRSFAIWTNMAFGILYTIIILTTMAFAPIYYKYFGLLESGLTFYVAWVAYKWWRPGKIR